jgi:hypothetical protein
MTNILNNELSTFDKESKVWIYTSSKVFDEKETCEIKELLTNFYTNWSSHGAKVKGYSTILHNRFIIFVADEKASGVSGCSIDKTVALLREIATKYQTNLFDRFLISYELNNQIETTTLADFKSKIDADLLEKNILVFNVHSTKLGDLTKWQIPYSESVYAKIEAPISFGL